MMAVSCRTELVADDRHPDAFGGELRVGRKGSAHVPRLPPARLFTGGRPASACRESNVIPAGSPAGPGPGVAPPDDRHKTCCKVNVSRNQARTVSSTVLCDPSGERREGLRRCLAGWMTGP